MTKFRQMTLGALVVAAFAAGCSQPGMPVAPQAVGADSAPSVMVAGKARKLGYDWKRYKQVIQPRQKPARMPRQGMIPSSADNRELQAPVYDQGKLGACTAFAIGKGLRESLQRRNKEEATSLSALFLYY